VALVFGVLAGILAHFFPSIVYIHLLGTVALWLGWAALCVFASCSAVNIAAYLIRLIRGRMAARSRGAVR
jgi:hypothetical protein